MNAPQATLTVRPRTAADLPALIEILRATHHANGYPAEWPSDPLAFLNQKEVADQQAKAWVAALKENALQERVVGHLLTKQPDGNGKIDWQTLTGGLLTNTLLLVSRLFVDPDAQGYGAARKLLDAAATEAQQLGLRLMLDVYPDAVRAISLYEQLGWVKTGEYMGHWLRRGTHPTVYVFVSPLT